MQTSLKHSKKFIVKLEFFNNNNQQNCKNNGMNFMVKFPIKIKI